MKLILKITSFHKFTPEIESVFAFESEDEYAKSTFGRSERCDWTLPDPERFVSGVHGEVIKFGEQYLIRDLSTNGIFINNSVTAVGQGKEIGLNSGDTFTLGEYQVEVAIESGAVEQRIDNQFHSDESLLLTQSTSTTVNNDFGLSASDIMKEDIPSDFNLDLGLVDDYIEAQNQEIVHDKLVQESSLPLSNHAPSVQNSSINEMDAFIRGMSIDPSLIPSDNREEWFEQIGRSFSLMLIGLMDTLHNRAEFKQNNRLSHTSFKKSENNPLKFSANLEDAIYNLYNRQASSFLPPDNAIKAAFCDIENHERALMKGVKGTVSGVMSLVEPTVINRNAEAKSGLLNKIIPARKHAHRWRVFEGIHNELKDEITNSEMPFYLDDFAKHYELYLKEED